MSYIPPAPPKKKSRWWVWVLVGVVAVYVANGLIETGQRVERERFNDTIDEVTENALSDDTSLEVLRLAWDMELTPLDRQNICDYYNTPPVGTTPEMVQTFAEGAEIPYDQAERLLDQLLAEEC